jgi:hypothetical protein
LGPNLAVFCRKNYTPAAMAPFFPVTVNSYPPTQPSGAAAATPLTTPFVPTIDITNPGMGSRLDYFDSRQSTYMVTSGGFVLDLEFIPPATLRVTSAGVPMDWTVPTTATIVVRGADSHRSWARSSKQVTLDRSSGFRRGWEHDDHG